MLESAALAGRSVARSLLLAVADAPPQRVLMGLDDACAARLLVPDDGAGQGPGYRFASLPAGDKTVQSTS